MPICYLMKKSKWEDSKIPIKLFQTQPTKEDIQMHPLFRTRTSEEREIAEDLLELSRSLPPKPTPTLISVDPTFLYPPLTPTESPVGPQDLEPTPTFTLLMTHSPAEESQTDKPTPLTPSTSEYSSDAENVCPNSSSSALEVEDSSSTDYSFEDLIVVERPPRRSSAKGTKKRRSTKSVSDEEISEYEDFIDDTVRGGRRKERYTCSDCGKHYATSSNLSRHKQTHRSLDSQNARRCPTCGKAYVSMPALSMHLLTHNLVHKCDVCGKGFSRPWLLQGHLRSHTGEKPYKCSQCGKTFADRSNLRAHMQTHSLAKNYKCRNCHKSFALKSYLNKHYDSACFQEPASDSSD